MDDKAIKRSVFDLRVLGQGITIEEVLKLANQELNGHPGELLEHLERLAVTTSKSNEKRLIWSPDRTRLAVIIDDFLYGRTMQIWSSESQHRICEIHIPEGEIQARWAPDGRGMGLAGVRLIKDHDIVNTPGCVYIYDTNTGEIVHRLGHGMVRAVAIEWDATGQRIASVDSANDVACWDALTGKRLANKKQTLQGLASSLTWSPDKSRIAIGSEKGRLNIIDAETCEHLLAVSDVKVSINKLTWSMNGQCVVGIDDIGNVLVWDASPAFEHALSEEFKVESLQKKAEDLGLRGQLTEALPLFDEWIQLRGDSTRARVGRAFGIYSRLRNYEGGAKDYKRLVEIDPENQTNWTNLAYCLQELNRTSEAIGVYTSALDALKLDSNDESIINVLIPRARYYLSIDQLVKAKQDMLAVATYGGSDHDMILERGLVHIQLNETSDYLSLCKQVLIKDNTSILGGSNAAMLCLLLPDAIEDYGSLIEWAKTQYNPSTDEGDAIYLGAALYRSGKYDEALSIFKKTAERNGKLTNGAYFLAMCYSRFGKTEEARKWLAKGNENTEKVLTRPSAFPWANRTIFKIFREEATRMINGEK